MQEAWHSSVPTRLLQKMDVLLNEASQAGGKGHLFCTGGGSCAPCNGRPGLCRATSGHPLAKTVAASAPLEYCAHPLCAAAGASAELPPMHLPPPELWLRPPALAWLSVLTWSAGQKLACKVHLTAISAHPMHCEVPCMRSRSSFSGTASMQTPLCIGAAAACCDPPCCFATEA